MDVVDALAPRRLGRGFRWLFAASTVNSVADGVALSAGPLLVASQTRDPFLVSLALFMQYLPMLLFGVIGGVAADRFDRKRIVVVVNLARAAVLAVLVATIAGGAVSVAVVLVALFLLGTAETLADAASGTLVPNLVDAADLGIANARIQGAALLTNQLILPPVGALLFVAGPAIPFATNAIAFVLGAVLTSRIAIDARPEHGDAASVRADLAEGFRWLLAHPPMRTLALTILAFNVTFGAAWSVLVLYASQRLGMDAVGFGLLTTATAIGGLIAAVAYGRIERRFTLAERIRVGLLIETATHLTLALTTLPAVALATLVVFGAHEFVWLATSTVVRQRAVPYAMLGRVTGLYRVANVGGLAVGTLLGGGLAAAFGVTAPFWFGFIGSAILVIVLWRRFDDIAHDSRSSAAEAAPPVNVPVSA